MRAAVTALAPMSVIVPLPVEASAADAPPRRAASHYLWAMLLARIYETLPLVCPICQAQMRIIAFITGASTVRKILDHIGESTLPLSIAPAHGPPLWVATMAWVGLCAGFVPFFGVDATNSCHRDGRGAESVMVLGWESD